MCVRLYCVHAGLLVVPVAVGSGRGLVTGSVPRESSVVSEAIEEEESPDADADYLDDYDSDVEERRSGRRKRRPPARTRTVTPAVAAPRTSQRGDGADKPFPCSSECRQQRSCNTCTNIPIKTALLFLCDQNLMSDGHKSIFSSSSSRRVTARTEYTFVTVPFYYC